jgi:hypothetical protein
MKNKKSGFKMKKFSGFGTKQYKAIDKLERQTTHADPGDFGKKPKIAKGKIAKKVAKKIGAKFIPYGGAALAVKDAYGTYKDIKKGMKPRKALRKNFLGF